jgi:hypothetical protein
MPWNVLLLPLLAGYFFCTDCNWAKFKYRRADGNRLVFASALFGVIFLGASVIIVYSLCYLASPGSRPDVWIRLWIKHNPFPHLGKSVLALGLSYVFTKTVNIFSSEDEAKSKVLKDEYETFELLLGSAVDQTKPLLISLSNQKVYVAFALDRLRLDRKQLSVLPLWGGYRDKDTKGVVFTTDYAAIYESIPEERRADFQLVIPAETVTSATLFDRDVWAEHFAEKKITP